ncbi:MAG: hypothetical protein AAGI38_06890 [Bacteroidota bacterium]
MDRAFVGLLVLLWVSCGSPEPSEPVQSPLDTITTPPPSQILRLDNPGTFTEVSYHPNGKIAAITKQGYVNSCSAPVGTHYFFSKTGKLEQEVTYDHWILSPDEGCHSSVIQELYIHTFHANGQLKSQYQLQSCYECEETKFGLWMTYDEAGNVLSEEFFEKEYREDK